MSQCQEIIKFDGNLYICIITEDHQFHHKVITRTVLSDGSDGPYSDCEHVIKWAS